MICWMTNSRPRVILEVGTRVILEVRSVCCDCCRVDECDERKAKFVAKNLVQRDIWLKDYRRVLLYIHRQMKTRTSIHRPMKRFETDHHQLYTIEVNKVAVSGDDDKWVIQEDGVATLAHGHYKLKTFMDTLVSVTSHLIYTCIKSIYTSAYLC